MQKTFSSGYKSSNLKALITFLLVLSCNLLTAQKNFVKLSVPVIWNKSEATYYILGSPHYPTGKAVSYGMNASYNRVLAKVFYAFGGFGYYRQAFGIIRPFNYETDLAFGFSTETYKYDNLQLLGGVGIKTNPSKKGFFANGQVSYNRFLSFRQRYTTTSPQPKQINNLIIPIGDMVNVGFGLNQKITRDISLGAEFILPVYVHWRNDDIFWRYQYDSETIRIGRDKSSLGFSISGNYDF